MRKIRDRVQILLLLLLALVLFGGMGCEVSDEAAFDDGNAINALTPCPCRDTEGRTIQFAGYTWAVRCTATPAPAGNNCFVDDERTVWVDAQGRLHLKISQQGGIWTCAEVVNVTPGFGYGNYTFKVESPVGQLNRNVVLGFFTWDDTAIPLGTVYEIDIEITTWSQVWGNNIHYSVQPVLGPDTDDGHYPERTSSAYMGDEVVNSIHAFQWSRDQVTFSSGVGTTDVTQAIGSWAFSKNSPGRRVNGSTLATPVVIPQPTAQTQVRINLWLNDGNGSGFGDAPSDGQEVEVIVSDFSFVPE